MYTTENSVICKMQSRLVLMGFHSTGSLLNLDEDNNLPNKAIVLAGVI